jgi:putative sugar O-methyltransferase
MSWRRSTTRTQPQPGASQQVISADVEAAAPPDRWAELTERQLTALDVCDPVYRPTNFWGPAVRQLLADMRTRGLPVFKSWPTAREWFYPVYGNGFNNASMKRLHETALTLNPKASDTFMSAALGGGHQSRRDFDAVRLFWDQSRWPFDLDGFGESRIGQPPQFYRMTGSTEIGWCKPYLNYLLCLSALSHHVDRAPTSVIEIGGGYGVLGEILMQRDPSVRYVNLDIPPLLTVASYYLTTLFGDAVRTFFDVPEEGPVALGASACLPNWRITDVTDTFDLFVNSYSFQEMEPDVVEHYVDAVCAKNVTYVVSLNSINGKPTADTMTEGGVIEAVTSARIIEFFEQRGYALRGRYRDPLIVSAGEIAVLERL